MSKARVWSAQIFNLCRPLAPLSHRQMEKGLGGKLRSQRDGRKFWWFARIQEKVGEAGTMLRRPSHLFQADLVLLYQAVTRSLNKDPLSFHSAGTDSTLELHS